MLIPRRLLCSAWVIFVAVAIPSSTAAAEREQLPPGVRPVHYDLALIPDAENLTFGGRVEITIDVKASAAAVVLNADDLVLDKAALDKEAAPAAVALDGKLQRATLTFAHP